MVIIHKIKWIFNKASSFNKLWNTKYYENEPRFNGLFSRDNLLKKIKDGVYVINLDEHKDTDTHWIALFCTRNKVIYFDSLGVEHIPKEIEKLISNKNIKEGNFRIQANNSIMYCYFCIEFIDLCLQEKHWLIMIIQICFLLMILIKMIK